ncbi:glycoside hydrolase family 78 protein [Bacillus sp. NP157]|nr:glycoside hydrolase family 78 protein [Bacillus sp. NP157]
MVRPGLACALALTLLPPLALAAAPDKDTTQVAMLAVTGLHTNALEHPLALSTTTAPRFSWKIDAGARDSVQTAWEVRLGKDGEANPLWDSGWTGDARQVGVAYQGGALAPGAAYAWQVRVRDNHGRVSAWSAPARFETGLDIAGDWKADWIGPADPSATSAVFRKRFTLPEAPVRARLYVTALGTYRMFLNGERTDGDVLAPGWTDYGKRIPYQAYDVTSQLHAGNNVIAAMLAPGWYAGHIASFGPAKYGKTPALSAQLRLQFADGRQAWVRSDGSWSTSAGPFREADIIMGETFDARALPGDWLRDGASTEGWKAAPVLPAPEARNALLRPQDDAPVRVTGQRESTVLARQPTRGARLFDLGQNMVGVVTLQMKARAGQQVQLRYGEMLNPDGSLYTANLRSAKATDRYIAAKDGEQSYTPTFTYHGFRYVEVTGLDAPADALKVTGLVEGSDLAWTGAMQVSDPMLTQLQSNITWGQRGNFFSIPTDTPARDERLGWAGDINVFAPTASFNQDTYAFLSKWLRDLRDAQTPEGDYPGVAPNPVGIESGAGWSDAGITVAYTLWHTYGDTRVIDDGYDSMQRFMALIERRAGPELRRVHGPWADWLHLDDPTPADLLGTAYLAYDARLMSEMAAATGHADDATRYASLATRATDAFNARYVHADGTLGSGSQTGYAMAIGMGLVEPKRVAAAFVRSIEAKHDHLSTGFLGTPWLLPALSAIGRNDLAYRLLLNRDYPSWGYEVGAGATTMWERWNSLKPDGTFGDVVMNSFNHYAYGAVGDWMYRHIVGIAPLEAGYRRFAVAPVPGGGLTYGGGHFDSAYGRIQTAWTVKGERFSLALTVPVGTTAEVTLPDGSHRTVGSGDYTLEAKLPAAH